MTKTKLFKNSAFSIFKNSRFVFNTKPEAGASPEQIEASRDIENTGYRLQKKFTQAVTKFKAQVEDTEKRSGTMTLKQQIQAYKKLGDILGPVAREVYAFLQKHPEQKVLLVDTHGENLKGITAVEGGLRMSVPDWAKAIGVGEQVITLVDRINEKTQELLQIGTKAVADFELQDAKFFENQFASAKDLSSLQDPHSTFESAKKILIGYKKSAQELQKIFGEQSPLGLSCGELVRQITALQTGTFARLNKAYIASCEKILTEITGTVSPPNTPPETAEDALSREADKARRAATEQAEEPDELPPKKETPKDKARREAQEMRRTVDEGTQKAVDAAKKALGTTEDDKITDPGQPE